MVTYQEATAQVALYEQEGEWEKARELEIWIDNELDKAYEAKQAALEELNRFGGGPRW